MLTKTEEEIMYKVVCSAIEDIKKKYGFKPKKDRIKVEKLEMSQIEQMLDIEIPTKIKGVARGKWKQIVNQIEDISIYT